MSSTSSASAATRARGRRSASGTSATPKSRSRHRGTLGNEPMPFLEDFTVGQVITTPARTIYMHDITNFAYLSADWHHYHTNDEAARASDFGGILAHGPLVLVAAYGLMARAGLFDEHSIGFLGLTWEMAAPVRP